MTKIIGKIGFTPKDEFVPGHPYEEFDVVSYEGGSYVSRVNENTALPTDSSKWFKQSEKGAKGDTGEKGEKMKFTDLTPAEKEELKGNVVLYNSMTEAEKNELAGRIPAVARVEDGDVGAVSGQEVFNSQFVVNVNHINNNTTNYSIDTAILEVPVNMRKRGQIIRFRVQESIWETWQYNGNTDKSDTAAGWKDLTRWSRLNFEFPLVNNTLNYVENDVHYNPNNKIKRYIDNVRFIDGGAGALIEANNNIVSERIKVSAGTYYLCCENPRNTQIIYKFENSYNNKGAAVLYTTPNSSSTTSLLYNEEIVIEEDCYIAVRGRKASTKRYQLYFSDVPNTGGVDLLAGNNLFKIEDFYGTIIGQRFNTSGSIITASDSVHMTEFINVEGVRRVYVTCEGGDRNPQVCGYTSIGSAPTLLLVTGQTSATQTFSNHPIEIPEGIKFIKAGGRVAPTINPENTLKVSVERFRYSSSDNSKSRRKFFAVGFPKPILSEIKPMSISTSYPLTSLYEIYDDLVDRFPNYVSKNILGKDAWENDLVEYVFKQRDPVQMDPDWNPIAWDSTVQNQKILIVGGLHGKEKAACIATAYAMKLLCESNSEEIKYLRNNAYYKVIACANPSGFQDYTRENRNGMDLNRDYVNYTQLETQIICSWIDENEDAVFLMDNHSVIYDRYAIATYAYRNLLKQIVLPINHYVKEDWQVTLGEKATPYISILNSRGTTIKDYTEVKGMDALTAEVPNSFSFPSKTTLSRILCK